MSKWLKLLMMKVKLKSLDYYFSLKYPISFYPEPEGYTAIIKSLPGCMSVGETLSEAMENIQEARELWIETAYECEDEIPLPAIPPEFQPTHPRNTIARITAYNLN